MLKVIVNSTPIIVLCGIGKLDILRELYGEVTIPTAVYQEVTAMEDSEKMKYIIASLLYGRLRLSIRSDQNRCRYQKRSLSHYVRKQIRIPVALRSRDCPAEEPPERNLWRFFRAGKTLFFSGEYFADFSLDYLAKMLYQNIGYTGGKSGWKMIY